MSNQSTAGTAQIIEAIPVLLAQDVAKAAEHYETKLGFIKVFAHGEPVSYAGVARDGVIIHLSQYDDARTICEQTMLRFKVQNVDALYEDIKARGAVHPNGALETKPWGTREFAVIDLDGVCISFFETPETEQEA
jgi:uncharacterized glyoxalase superfamily protein PhnB